MAKKQSSIPLILYQENIVSLLWLIFRNKWNHLADILKINICIIQCTVRLYEPELTW